jgi:hypothetical protein
MDPGLALDCRRFYGSRWFVNHPALPGGAGMSETATGSGDAEELRSRAERLRLNASALLAGAEILEAQAAKAKEAAKTAEASNPTNSFLHLAGLEKVFQAPVTLTRPVFRVRPDGFFDCSLEEYQEMRIFLVLRPGG